MQRVTNPLRGVSGFPTRSCLSLRAFYTPHKRLNSTGPPRPKQSLVEGAVDISHSHFISSASPASDFNPTQNRFAGLETAHKWEGKLSPTTSHLFKLILPLPRRGQPDSPQPTAFLLHPSQPLSHLSRLIVGCLPPDQRDVDIQYLALTGQESDLDSHLRNAEEGEEEEGDEGSDEVDAEMVSPAETSSGKRQEGGPYLNERSSEEGRWQEVSWSTSTDLSDFIKQSCLNERFKIRIQPQSKGPESALKPMTLEVVIPSFESRTRYLRKRLLGLTKELDEMTKKKKYIDVEAHKGARQLIVAGLVAGAGYWIAVIRWTFFSEAGWDVMEPVTWTVGFGGLLASAAFLAYHNREVSYSSILDLSVTARQRALYDKQGLDIDRWTEMVAEAKTLRKEIIRIAADYDIEWKGELENLASHARRPILSRDHASGAGGMSREESQVGAEGGEVEEKLDIDKTIDEADDLASQTEEQRQKEKAAQRKGEAVEDGTSGRTKKSHKELGEERARKYVEQR